MGPPVVYLLNGDDEFALNRYVADLQAKLEDPGLAAMNTARLDGRAFNMDELLSVASAMPFLARRRIVVIENPLVRLETQQARQKFLENLAKIPPTTALVLVEYRQLTPYRDRESGKLHWLEKWAQANSDRAIVKTYVLPRGDGMVSWVREHAKSEGGGFSVGAAQKLAALVGNDTRLAHQEIQKLLTYVDNKRLVDEKDVELLTADSAQGDIFALVDAIGHQRSKDAMQMLQRLLDEQDPLSIFGMILRQFRLLLLGREVMDQGGSLNEISSQLGVQKFVARKVAEQAPNFSLNQLGAIYHQLLDMDVSVKTGEMPIDLALETLVARLSSSS